MQRLFVFLTVFFTIFALPFPYELFVNAGENSQTVLRYFVDPVKGSDVGAGTAAEPLKTVSKALSRIDGRGGEIHLAPGTIFRENIFINRKLGGSPEAPLLIDGHGAVINIGIDVTEGPWTKLDEGYRLERDVPEHKNHYGISVAFVNGLPLYHNLPEGRGQRAWHGGSVRYDEDGRLIVIFPKGLDPTRSVIVLTGKNENFSCFAANSASYVTVRNLTSVFAGNDGFNFHGLGAVNFRLENVTALFCGDEGISAHEDYQTEVLDSEVAFCGSLDGGIADVNDSQSVYRNVRVHQNRTKGFKLIGSRHVLNGCVSYGNPEGNLPRETDKVSLTDCRDDGQLEEEKAVPIYHIDQPVPARGGKVKESDRLVRFLQYRPPKEPTR